MSDIIFARTRYNYDSYSDLWRLVELSGFSTCYVDEIDASDASKCYIFTPANGEIKRDDVFIGWPDAKAKVIFWNIEQGDYGPIPGVAETWCSDVTLAKICGAKYVMMGSHPGLRLAMPQQQVPGTYDFVALAYWTHRRLIIKDRLKERGVRIAPDCWGDLRHVTLLASSYMLHIHQNDGLPFIAPQRWCLAAAYHLPLISEVVGHRGGFPIDTFKELDYNFMRYTMTPERLNHADMGERLYQHLCIDNTFRRQVERHV